MNEAVGTRMDITIDCGHCGGAMRVAREHIHVTVACPHCKHELQPWRVLGGSVELSAWLPEADRPQRRFATEDGYSWRLRWVAGLLGLLLGPWGVHRFYLGFTGIGFLQIIVTIVTFGVGGLWGMIEGALCFAGAIHDVDGLPLRDGHDGLPLQCDANGLPLQRCKIR